MNDKHSMLSNTPHMNNLRENSDIDKAAKLVGEVLDRAIVRDNRLWTDQPIEVQELGRISAMLDEFCTITPEDDRRCPACGAEDDHCECQGD
jgi:hypothetical protein